MRISSPRHGYPETLSLTIRTPVERLLVKRALVLAQELEAVSERAEPDQVLDYCKQVAVEKGGECTQSALEATMHAYVDRQGKIRRELATVASVGKAKERTGIA